MNKKNLFFIAATPSYFFTPPQAGHNFFFSELLRSLVQKRKVEELNAVAMKAKTITKKARKPTFQQFPKIPCEQDYKKPKLCEEALRPAEVIENDQENSQDSVINVDKDDPPSVTTTTTSCNNSSPLIPTLAQSAFYPYVDPLHFFIDLKVSAGQIYDRKKEAYLQQALKNNNILLDSNTWSNTNPMPMIGRNRNSAFKVPDSQMQNFNAINLISNQESPAKGYHKIYKSSRSDDDEIQENKSEEESKSIFDLDKSNDTKRM